MKKILSSMFYSILVGEEPDSDRKQNQVKMIRITTFFLRQRSYQFRRNCSYISFQFPFKSSMVQLHCIARIHVVYLKQVDLLASLHGTALFPRSPLSPQSTEKKYRTGTNSSSRTKGLTEPGQLTNTNIIEKNRKDLSFLYTIHKWIFLLDFECIFFFWIPNKVVE
ncbi:hypothetical protein Taro_006879 [Colocasia esculenta]|uniref:Ycf15 n=1 Tax=Colocasia esculenta TaxID=4460 RepID=A0A843TTX9_COLES|nr:hypothetical protein [Colocasia esculenta]